MNTYEKIYQKLVKDSEDTPEGVTVGHLPEAAKEGATIIKSGSHTEGLSIEELAEKYNIDKEALKRAISLSKSLRQGEV
ncbi:TPA: hypothetical protein RZV72_004873 [Escherichia coli]|uniref:hypothetical protein n=1 Tax=Escherichia coli TaxID=562 RepID=UPI0010CB5BC9|nr:hypothetical protein [Escherichia coli]EFF5407665.1 hypothetical protein [Escherichia coli]EHN1923520.1 hypothetical protein [Escherichia coli]EIE6527216.1 hypothetical protein [Escherichia coli]ELO9219207.1 hypothetical protein [Escherichia coli]ELS5507351.1 hypothetical protein [Escherichia coli]